jgi:hypothetical protein
MAGAEAAEHGDAGAVRPGVHAGFSTGTSGARGTFLSSKPERARYLGQCLAKLLPGSPLRRRRIGLCLRANNALYRDVANAGPFEFRFFSLDAPAQSRASEIEGFAPDIFVAPSHVLAELALLATEGKFRAPPFERLLYGAEPMGAWERVWITEALGARPDPIYQATEGFLGSACSRGVLHLNEDSIAFEFDPIAGVIDFVRSSLICVARANRLCACGWTTSYSFVIRHARVDRCCRRSNLSRGASPISGAGTRCASFRDRSSTPSPRRCHRRMSGGLLHPRPASVLLATDHAQIRLALRS